MAKALDTAPTSETTITDLENPVNDTLAGVRLLEVVLEDLLSPEYIATGKFHGQPSFKFDSEDRAAVMHALRCTRRSIEEARDILEELFRHRECSSQGSTKKPGNSQQAIDPV